MYGRSQLTVLLSPLLLLLALGVVLPFLRAIGQSIFAAKSLGSPYAALAADPTFWLVLVRTLETGATVAVVCLLIAYPTAEFLRRVPSQVRPIAFALVIVPLLSSTIARTYSWVGVFQRDGVLDQVSAMLGGAQLMLLYTPTAVVIGMVHVLLPLVLLPAYAAVQGYDERLSFASRSLGAGAIRTLVRVKLPAIAPQLLAATLGVFVISLGFFVTPAILGGPKSQLIANLISQQIVDRYDLERAQAMSVVLLAATIGSLVLLTAIGRAIAHARR